MAQPKSIARPHESQIVANKVLRNTYWLLSLTLLFSALMATIAMMANAAPMNIFVFLIAVIGLPLAISATAKSTMGVVLTFCYTGFLGWSIGPILNLYIQQFTNGAELIMIAFGMTGLIFLGLSLVAMNPERNFSHWGSFLGIGALIVVAAFFINIIFFHIPALAMALGVVIAFISGGFIMYQTNAIVRGGETNYVIATVTIFASLYNIFLVLLQLLGMFAGDRG